MSKKKLGFGLMRLPSLDPNDPSKIDIEQTKKMVDTFIERGFTYFDTAWMYCGFNSENAAKEALVSRYPRDAYTLATKLHSGFIKTKEIVIVFLMNNVQKQVLIILITIYYMISIPIVLKFIMN